MVVKNESMQIVAELIFFVVAIFQLGNKYNFPNLT